MLGLHLHLTACAAAAAIGLGALVAGTTAATAAPASHSAAVAPDAGSSYVPLTPRRVADTRTGQGGIVTTDGARPPYNGRLIGNTLYSFRYDGNDVPQGVAAHVFNVTSAHEAFTIGNLRVGPLCDPGSNLPATAPPPTSLINYDLGVHANLVVVPDTCEGLRLYSADSRAAVVLDLVGYYPSGSDISTLASPARLYDTRGLSGDAGRLPPNTSRSFQITGVGGVPAGATAVALNITAVHPGRGHGNLVAYPDDGSGRPIASNINYHPEAAYPRGPAADTAGFVVIGLPPNGRINLFTARSGTDVIIDAWAYFTDSSDLVARDPVRILDTRTTTALRANETRTVQVTGLGGVPADARAVLVSVTAVTPWGAGGNLRVFPAGQAVPVSSTVNYQRGFDFHGCATSNFAVVGIGAGGRIALHTGGSSADVLLDVFGFVPA